MMRAIHLRAPNRSSSRFGWHLEDEIGDEEDAGAEAERGLRQAEILVHRQRGKADVYPVEIRNEVADDEEGYETFGHLCEGPDFYFVHMMGAWQVSRLFAWAAARRARRLSQFITTARMT
jgi:hypothetical protein